MSKRVGSVGFFMLVIIFGTAPLFAQSSGNFAASLNTAQCVVNDTSGSLTGGIGGTLLETTIKTPNAGSTALLIRPSMVTGLFTKTKITQYDTEATAVAGVQVRVLLDGNVVAPGKGYGQAAGAEDGWIYYDKRFQQLSSNLFGQITTCGTTVGTPDCYIELVLSTLSAHSLDFVAPSVGGGEHALQVQWRLQPTSETANEKSCVGPGVLTVEQVKTFSTGGGIVIQ